jgi:protein SPT2
MMSKPALKRPPSRDIDHERRLLKKKKPARSEDQEAFDMLRQLLPPKRFSRYDDDDINMEAGFEDIQKEERRRYMSIFVITRFIYLCFLDIP